MSTTPPARPHSSSLNGNIPAAELADVKQELCAVSQQLKSGKQDRAGVSDQSGAERDARYTAEQRGLDLGERLAEAARHQALAVLREQHPTLETLQAMTLVFSAKESVFKAAFAQVGRHFDFADVEIRDIEPHAGRLTLRPRVSLAARLPAGSRLYCHYLFPEAETVLTVCALPA